MKSSRTLTKAGAALFILAASASHLLAQGFLTSQKAYITPTPGSDYQFTPIITAGEFVPLTGGSANQNYQLVGIPDGLGAYKASNGSVIVYCNHEFNNAQSCIPQKNGILNPVNGTLSGTITNGPSFRGAFVSKFILDGTTGGVISAGPAYSKVYQDDTLIGDIQTSLNPAVRPFTRFCSGSLAGTESGFDRPIFFANEEGGMPDSFHPTHGSQSVAIFDNNGVGEAHALSYFGFFPWENTLIMPRRDSYTVAMCMEDGPASTDNQLYMYVGRKVRSASATVLQKNGLVGGKLYALRSTSAGFTSESNFTAHGTSITAEWVEVPNANTLTAAQLETASDNLVGGAAFGFVRTEDGTFDKKTPTQDYYFVTTGSGGPNQLGRMYHVRWSNPANPLSPVTLTMLYNGDTVNAGAGDIAFSPDNMDNNGTRMMICEDGTTQSRAAMTARGRDGYIWSFDIPAGTPLTSAATLATKKGQAELDPPAPAPNNQSTTSGIWESTGIIDASGLFGLDRWLLNVQAHPPTTAPADTTENGQMLLMRPAALPQ
jgi:hypothetical protein